MVSAFRRIRAPTKLSNLVLCRKSVAVISKIVFLGFLSSFLEVLQASTLSESLLFWLCLMLYTSCGVSEGGALDRGVQALLHSMTVGRERPAAAGSGLSTVGGSGGGSPSNFRRGGMSPGGIESGHLGSQGTDSCSTDGLRLLFNDRLPNDEGLGELESTTFEPFGSGWRRKLTFALRCLENLGFRAEAALFGRFDPLPCLASCCCWAPGLKDLPSPSSMAPPGLVIWRSRRS
mmetsp:Transcript_58751/g.182213  ORF Transcript_58751/g.182213 Transcript_58751/m.182213 type:complete len:233 (-) Transcript_58751:207-905(-)